MIKTPIRKYPKTDPFNATIARVYAATGGQDDGLLEIRELGIVNEMEMAIRSSFETFLRTRNMVEAFRTLGMVDTADKLEVEVRVIGLNIHRMIAARSVLVNANKPKAPNVKGGLGVNFDGEEEHVRRRIDL